MPPTSATSWALISYVMSYIINKGAGRGQAIGQKRKGRFSCLVFALVLALALPLSCSCLVWVLLLLLLLLLLLGLGLDLKEG